MTSRTYAYQQQEWRLRGFAETVLAPFTPWQIRCFVDLWYQHIASVRHMNPNDAQGRAELLKRAIFTSNRLSELAERPLLLTLMASLHAWRGGSLPEGREELYNDTVELLLDWWERPKVVRDAAGQALISQESLAELLNVGKDHVRETLSALAFRVHQSQRDVVGTADIDQRDLVDELMHINQSKDLRPVRLIEYLTDRAGLLISRGVGVYTFPHRTFQEYLAACHLTDQDEYPDNIAELARHEPNRWREIVLLAGARAARVAPMIWVLVDALCYQDPEGKNITPEDAWGALLAGQALVETANLQKISLRNLPKIERLRKWLVAILTEQQPSETPLPALERALAGNVLARLGDPRQGIGLRDDELPDIVWCEVPKGTFLMGSDPEKDERAYNTERPQHTVELSAYQIGRYPVTKAQYHPFFEGGGYTEQWRQCWTEEGWDWKIRENFNGPRRVSGDFDLPNHPMVGVSWYEVTAFCDWLTLQLRETGELTARQEIRLPTEAEWEKAARGIDGRCFPWGNEDISAELANYNETGLGVTSAVGCFPRGVSPYGCEEMVGNVREWCSDWMSENYYAQSPRENPQGPVSGSLPVYRGGGWDSIARNCRASTRGSRPPATRYHGRGFRLVKASG